MTRTSPPNPPAGRPTHRLDGPADLLRAVPYLLGFHPEVSLVLVGLDRGRLVVTARLDLLDAAEPELIVDTVDALVDGGATSLVAVVWDGLEAAGADLPHPMTGALPWDDVIRLVAVAADAAGLGVVDELLVSDGRWWSYLCAGAGCCPSEGRLLPRAPSAFAVAATVAGVVALPSRADLVALLDPLPEAERRRLGPDIETAQHEVVAAVLGAGAERLERSIKRAMFAAARAAGDPGWTVPDDASLARFAVALGETALRDAVWLAVDHGRLDGRALWLELARRVPTPYDAAPLFLYGWASWRAGDGAVARAAAERAVESDPGYSAADLLLAALSRGVNPHNLPRLRSPRPTLPPSSRAARRSASRHVRRVG